jgi:menaquinone-specific isochorismate synthase
MTSLIDWLEKQTLYPKLFWRDKRDGVSIAGVGQIETASWPRESDRRFFGGLSFSKKRKDGLWQAFPDSYFFLPAVELHEREGKQTLIFNGEMVPLETVATPAESIHWPPYEAIERVDTPSFESWKDAVDACLSHIREGVFEKAVLARRTTLSCKRAVNPFPILKAVASRSSETTLFAFGFREGSLFMGATPETLYRRDGNEVVSEAVAGTRARGKNGDEEARLREELLSCEKENREFASVQRFISEALKTTCSGIEEGPKQVVTASHLQHFYQMYRGSLKKSVSDRDLIDALHPTSAIGGHPRKEALDFIASHEPFERGWYAAPVGWIEKERSHFAVGIRSALIEDDKLHLFAGTGIVAGSDAHREWQELEHKISGYL